MSFHIRADVEKWFEKLKNTAAWKTSWDPYYFCLMVGLAAGKTSKPKKATEFVRDFVGEYRESSKEMIIGLLIFAELGRHSIPISDKEQVRKTIKDLIKPNSVTGLTDDGLKLLDEYSSGGYDLFQEEGFPKPELPEVFLRTYPDFLGKYLKKNPMVEGK